MGYTYQSPEISLIGDKSDSVLSPEKLGAEYAYGASGSLSIGGMSKADFYVSYGMGSSETSNSAELQIEMTPNKEGVLWYKKVGETQSGNQTALNIHEYTFTGTDSDTLRICFPINIQGKTMTVRAKETGMATNAGYVYVGVVLSGEK